MKKIVFVLPFLCFWYVGFAQTPTDEFINRMNYVFANVNRNNVSTGLLSNYGAQAIPLEYYNGVPADSNYVDLDSYKLLYAGLYSSKFNSNITLITPDELSTRIQSYTSGTAIPVSIMHYAYNRIKETAVEQGLVNVVNEQIFEIAGKNPYETLNLFVAGPKNVIITGGAVSFIFPSSLRMTNVTKTVQNLQVRFDENLAFVTTGWNTAVSHNYATQGVKKVRFKINYTDGTSFTSQTNIAVTIPPTGGSTRAAGPDDAAGIGGAQYDIPIAANSLHSGGTIQVKLATSNTTGKIKKALIIAEGFDPYPLLTAINTNLYLLMQFPTRTDNIIPELYGVDMNYDIVYVDNKVGTDDIKRNAELFIHAISIINSSAYRNTYATQNVVMGISMGGLVARYALRKMETKGIDHKTWKYISMDSPHKGANVPVGFQGAVRHFSSIDFKFFFRTIFKMTDIPIVNDALLVLNSPAAKQMLIYNVNEAGTGYDNSTHDAFYAEYDRMGFPQKCQNVAVSNGISNGQVLFAPGSSLVDVNYTYTLTFLQEFVNILLTHHPFTAFYVNGTILGSNYPQLLLNIVPGKTQLGAYVKVNAISTSPNSTVYSGSIKFHKKILWLINSSVPLTSSTLKTQSGMYSIDGASGGIIDLNNYMSKVPADFRPYIKQTKFCFIPRGSSLALSDWNTNLTANLQGVDIFALGKTEFEHASMSLTKSEPHVTFAESKQFIINQLRDKPISPNMFQSAFCGNQNVTLSNPQNVPLTWSVSDNTFRITSPTNTSATIASAADARNAIVSISSTNTYPLRKRLFSTCNLSISGPSTICDQATYTIENLPQGAPVQWSVSNTSIASINTSGVLTRRGNGICEVRAIINIGGTSLSLKPIKVQVGAPNGTDIILTVESSNFNGVLCTDNPNAMYANHPSEEKLNPIFEYEWNISSGWQIAEHPGNINELNPTNFIVTVIPINPGFENPTVSVRARNGCGWGSWKNVQVPAAACRSGQFSLSPNPATDVVTLQLQEESLSAEQSVLSTQKINKAASGAYEIQLWSGTALLKTYTTDQSTFQIPVSGLSQGLYFVRVIKDGKTYTQKLLVN